MLKRDELIKIIEEYRLSHIQSEAEVRSKLIVPLIEWLGYPAQFRAEEFPVYGNGGGTPLPAKHVDFLLFDDAEFGDNRERKRSQLDWVGNHSLLVVEAKKPDEITESNAQPQFYSAWTRAVAYIFIDGNRIRGYLLGKTTADVSIFDCDVCELPTNEDFLQFSYKNIRQLKENGVESIRTLTPIRYKRKLSLLCSPGIPDLKGATLITRYIVPASTYTNDYKEAQLPLPFDYLKQEKRIIVLAEAGHGKTYSLYQIFNEALHQGYHPFFYFLRSLPEMNVLSMIAQDEIEVDEKVVFILDGLDEMSSEKRAWLLQNIENTASLYPEVLIIVSSRSNLVLSQPNTDKFKMFTIKDITAEEITGYLGKLDIDAQQWIQQVAAQNLEQFCTNAFYLTELINIWQLNGALPNRSSLMKEIVDSRIRTDIGRIQDKSVILSQRVSDAQKAFERVALIMQCMQSFSLSPEQMDRLFEAEKQQIMSCHGLWTVLDDGSFGFTHNNFREYFAAVSLSHKSFTEIKRFVGEGNELKTIKPSWNNVLSYLVTLYTPHELQDWICEIQPSLIILFEKNRINDEFIADTLQRIMNIHKEQHSWIDPNYTILRKLAAFCSVPGSVLYVINEIEQPQTIRHKKNLLRCLAEFTFYFDQAQRVKETVIAIACNKAEEVSVRSDAFDVMRNHPELFIELTDNAAALFQNETNEYLKYSILSFIERTGKAEQYIDIVIDAYDKYSHRESHFISYKILIDRIFTCIQEVSTADSLLRYLLEGKIRLFNEESAKLFSICCNVGMKHYNGDDDCILLSLLHLIGEAKRLLSHSIYDTISRYIVYTQTELLFVRHIVAHQPLDRCGYILSQIVSDSIIDTIISMLSDKEIDVLIVKHIISFLPYGDEKAKKLIRAVFIYTGEVVQTAPPKDHEHERFINHQRFFDALFDKVLFDALVDELIAFLGGSPEISDESLHKLTSDLSLNKEALLDCYFSLQHIIPQNQHVLIENYNKYIKDWNAFCYISAENSIHRHSININHEQETYLKTYCLEYFENSNIDEAVEVSENRLSAPELLFASGRLFHRLSIQSSEELALKLVALPSVIFDHDNYDQIPQCLIALISEDKLKNRVIELMKSTKLNSYSAPAYIHYCLEHQISECKEYVVHYLLDNAQKEGSTYWELEYLEKMFGIGLIISDILPHCENDDMLLSISARIPTQVVSQVLEDKLWEAYQTKKDICWLGELIKHNSVKGLLEYYKEATERMTLPDMVGEPAVPETTEAIREIDSVQCLSVLIDLLKLSYNVSFVDREFFGLKSSCWNAILTIGQSNYTETRAILFAAQKRDCLSAFDYALLDLIQAMDEVQQRALDQPVDFETAIILASE